MDTIILLLAEYIKKGKNKWEKLEFSEQQLVISYYRIYEKPFVNCHTDIVMIDLKKLMPFFFGDTQNVSR